MANFKLLDGKLVARHSNEQTQKLADNLKKQGVTPGLAVVLVGDDPASAIYVKRKGQMCEKLGFRSETIRLSAETTQDELLNLVQKLNADKSYHGILVQMPLPKQIDPRVVIDNIAYIKDVDCFHPHNVGLLAIGEPYMLPCTPAGILEILKYYNISAQGKHVVVLGRSNIVGKPMANLLVQKNKYANATVTVCHSRTHDIASHTRQADILVAAIGQAEFVNKDMVKKGCVVVDVGMNRVDAPETEKGYRLCGDVLFEEVAPVCEAITPVPGGVGPMTIAMLMRNTVNAAAAQNNITLG